MIYLLIGMILALLFMGCESVLILIAYYLGLKYGQKISFNERIDNYSNEDKNALKDEIERDKQNEEILINNVEAYDGTDKGQKDFVV